jgi:hypothetical protein
MLRLSWWLAAVLLGTVCLARPAPDADPPSEPIDVATMFEQALEQEGLDAACTRLREALADTSGSFSIDPYRLALALPQRLVVSGRPEASLALVKLLEGRFGEDPRYWKELGKAYLMNLDGPGARQALERSLAMEPDQPDLPWTLANLDRLLATIELQRRWQGRYRPGQNTGLRGPYLGQAPPGDQPEVFAPGILSTLDHEYSISISPDGREIIFSRSDKGTLVSRWLDEGWTYPELLVLVDEEHLTEEASISPDGQWIFFCCRPLDMRGAREIYLAPREGDGWGQARHLFPGMYPTATSDLTLYYTAEGERPDYGVLVCRRRLGEGYGEPEVLQGGGVNSPAPDAHPYISADESLLVFDTYRRSGPGLYASRRLPDGTWGQAVYLSEKLGIPPAGQPALSPDGRYLFFCLAGDMYWVRADVLDSLD